MHGRRPIPRPGGLPPRSSTGCALVSKTGAGEFEPLCSCKPKSLDVCPTMMVADVRRAEADQTERSNVENSTACRMYRLRGFNHSLVLCGCPAPPIGGRVVVPGQISGRVCLDFMNQYLPSISGHGIVAVHLPSKQNRWVRSPLPALPLQGRYGRH